MNIDSSLPTLTFDPISNIRLTRMPSRPQPRDKLYELDGVRFRISERFVYKPRLNAGSAWQLYDGMTIPRKEELVLVGNPNMRSSKLVYILADQAEYRMLDISEIPFVTRATTRNIINVPDRMRFGHQSDNFQFTFGTKETTKVVPPQSQVHVPAIPPSLTLVSTQPQSQSKLVSPVAACIAAITSYLDFTSQNSGRTAQKRSRETAFEGDNQDIRANRRHCRRPGVSPNPYGLWLSRVVFSTN